jgi:hypothetical protein
MKISRSGRLGSSEVTGRKSLNFGVLQLLWVSSLALINPFSVHVENTCPALLESCTKPSARRGQDSWLTVPPRLYPLRKGEFPKAKLKCKATEAVMEDDQVCKSWLFLFFPHFTVSFPQQGGQGSTSPRGPHALRLSTLLALPPCVLSSQSNKLPTEWRMKNVTQTAATSQEAEARSGVHFGLLSLECGLFGTPSSSFFGL